MSMNHMIACRLLSEIKTKMTCLYHDEIDELPEKYACIINDLIQRNPEDFLPPLVAALRATAVIERKITDRGIITSDDLKLLRKVAGTLAGRKSKFR